MRQQVATESYIGQGKGQGTVWQGRGKQEMRIHNRKAQTFKVWELKGFGGSVQSITPQALIPKVVQDTRAKGGQGH